MGVAFSLPQPLPGPGFLGMFPKLWRVTVTVVRSGGRDAKGNPTPSFEVTLPDCLIAPRATADPVDRSDVVDGKAVLYRGPGFRFLSTDRIRVPVGALMAGEWSVDGQPGEWPYGVEVGLVRAT